MTEILTIATLLKNVGTKLNKNTLLIEKNYVNIFDPPLELHIKSNLERGRIEIVNKIKAAIYILSGPAPLNKNSAIQLIN